MARFARRDRRHPPRRTGIGLDGRPRRRRGNRVLPASAPPRPRRIAMPELDEIRARWDSSAGWSAAGDEWSGPWGGSDRLWWGTLLPRIHPFVPAERILELGPGQGRWSQYLRNLCD